MASAVAQTRASQPARAFWTAVHRIAGLATALFLIMSGITGAIISWDHEIDEWLNPDLFFIDSRGPHRKPTEMAEAIADWDSRVVASCLSVSYEEGHSAVFFVRPLKDPATGKPFKLNYNKVFVDPVTAKVVGKRDSCAVTLSTRELIVAADARLTRGADLQLPLPTTTVAQQLRQATLRSPGQSAVGASTAKGSTYGWRTHSKKKHRPLRCQACGIGVLLSWNSQSSRHVAGHSSASVSARILRSRMATSDVEDTPQGSDPKKGASQHMMRQAQSRVVG